MHPAVRPGLPVVSCSKGIERGTCALMPEVIAEALPQARIAVLAGPSFAKEVALGLATGVTLASSDRPLAEQLAQALTSARFRVYTSDDPDQRDHRRRVQERARHRLRHRHRSQYGRERARAADCSRAIRDGVHRPRQGRQSRQPAWASPAAATSP